MPTPAELAELTVSMDIATRLVDLRTRTDDTKLSSDQKTLLVIARLASAHLDACLEFRAAEKQQQEQPSPNASKRHAEARGALAEAESLLKIALSRSA